MFALLAAVLSISAAVLAVSAAYYRSARACLIRSLITVALSLASVAFAILTPILFFSSPGASVEWAANAFSMFLRFAAVISVFVTGVLIFSLFFEKKPRNRVMRLAVGAFFTVAAVMFTALFSVLCADDSLFVHRYVEALGLSCAALPFIPLLLDDGMMLLRLRGDKSHSDEKNINK